MPKQNEDFRFSAPLTRWEYQVLVPEDEEDGVIVVSKWICIHDPDEDWAMSMRAFRGMGEALTWIAKEQEVKVEFDPWEGLGEEEGEGSATLPPIGPGEVEGYMEPPGS